MVSYIVLLVLILCSEAILLCLPTVLLHHGHIIIIGSAVKIVLLPWWVRRPRRDPNRQLTLECSMVDRMGWNQFWKSILVLTYGPWSPALFYVLMSPINMNPFCCTLTIHYTTQYSQNESSFLIKSKLLHGTTSRIIEVAIAQIPWF